ncbi:MAG: hypothetical protein PHW63_06080 [Alphaproteobacteria bacterium]|nr:hypothetical protein [Alphaproteobacteria bacterium]
MMCVFLAACADMRGPQWLTGEPDESVLNAPRVVGKPSGATVKTWPNLADVPKEKPVFSTLKDRQEELVDLNSDKLKAQADMERIRNVQLEERTREDDSTTQMLLSSPETSP